MRRSAVLATSVLATSLLVLAGACDDDDTSEGTTTSAPSTTGPTTTAATTTSTPTTSTTTTTLPPTTTAPSTTTTTAAPPSRTAPGGLPAVPAGACGALPAVPGALSITTASADADGDGAADTLTGYATSAGGSPTWHLRVALAAGGGAEAVVSDVEPASVRPLGGYPLWFGLGAENPDLHDALFATVGAGAAGPIVGVYQLTGCALGPVDGPTGVAVELPVTATVGTQSGFACDAGAGSRWLDVWVSSTSDGITYELREGQLKGSGPGLIGSLPDMAGPVSRTLSSPADDAEIATLGSIVNCPFSL